MGLSFHLLAHSSIWRSQDHSPSCDLSLEHTSRSASRTFAHVQSVARSFNPFPIRRYLADCQLPEFSWRDIPPKSDSSSFVQPGIGSYLGGPPQGDIHH